MRTLQFLITVWSTFMVTLTFGQNSQLIPDRPLLPARGHYQQLAAIDPKPAKPNDSINLLRFPFDFVLSARRLSLTPIYLAGVNANEFAIADPPANSSAQTRAELNYLLGLQAQRSPLDIMSGLFFADVYYDPRIQPGDSSYKRVRRNLFHIGRSMGTWFNPDSLPLTADLMAKVSQDALFYIWSMKDRFARVRPYVLEPQLRNLQETNWAAYPSGHAANSYINAYIFMELAPKFSDILLKDAYDMAHSREIIGVHYPSDSEASRQFARQFVNKLFHTPSFQRDFARVKDEWAHRAAESFKKPSITFPNPGQLDDCIKSCKKMVNGYQK